MMNAEKIRPLWWSLFDPDSRMGQEEAVVILDRIRKEAMEFGDMVLDRGCHDYWYPSFQKLRHAAESNPAENFPGRYLVVPILISGLKYGAAVEAFLRRLNKSHGLVFVSYVTNFSQDQGERKNEFRSGIGVPEGLYIPEPELSALRANSDKPVLMADDISLSLDTLKRADAKLEGLGFRERYSMVSIGTIYESAGLISPTSYNKVRHTRNQSMWIT